MDNEDVARSDLVRLSRSLFERGFSVGSAGNISLAVADGYLMTPTNFCLGTLKPERISKLDAGWKHVGGDAPSKELPLHRAFYETRAGTGAVVHLHSTYATAFSCLTELDADDCVPPLTPYVTMRVGKVKLLPYLPPGDAGLGDFIRALNGAYAAVLLANHGPVVAGRDLTATVYAAEELEETAKLLLILKGHKTRALDAEQVEELHRRF
jgi:ribulose-5-phosphate 4-epimerase/fuculose-1-phosphate aldolase